MIERLLGILISIAAVYTALSLLASWVQEQIAGVGNLRGRALAKGILQMIGDAETRADLYRQPSIASSQPPGMSRKASSAASKDTVWRQPSYLGIHQFSSAVIGILTTGQAVATTAEEALSASLSGIAGLPDCRLKAGLQTVAMEAAGDYQRFVSGIEQWFSDQMDRVSGWYRRSSQIWLIFVAAAVAGASNADTLRLVEAFAITPLPISSGSIANGGQAEQDLSRLVFSNVHFGWPDAPHCITQRGSQPGGGQSPQCAEPIRVWAVVLKVLGLGLTTIALTFGAPFWFDMLQRFVNVRNAGPPPKKTDSQ